MPKKILAGLAIYSYFAQMEGWLHHERNVKTPLHANKTRQKIARQCREQRKKWDTRLRDATTEFNDTNQDHQMDL